MLKLRIYAFALDYLVILALLGLVALAFLGLGSIPPLADALRALTSSPTGGQLLGFLTATLPVGLYFALNEGRTGATWGKRRLGLRVRTLAGEAVHPPRAALRTALKFVPWELAHTCLWRIPGWPLEPGEPGGWVVAGLWLVWALVGLNLLLIGTTKPGRALYDLFAGTAVERQPRV